MAESTRARRCAFCNKLLPEPGQRKGRRSDYCPKLCQGRAQRQRDRARRAGRDIGHVPRAVATDLVAQAEELHSLVHGDGPLASVFHLAGQAKESAGRLETAAAAVARAEGKEWSEIGAAAGITEASARARWGGAKAAKLLAGTTAGAGRTAQPPVHRIRPYEDRVLVPAVSAVREQAHRLGNALKTLQQRSGLSLEHLASRAEAPLAHVQLVIEGQAVAPWPLTYVLADLLGGDPADVRWLWERAWYGTSRLDPVGRPGALSAILRGARLAAGAPELSVVSGRAGLAPQEAASLLEGRIEPDWDVFSRLFTSLGGDAEVLRPPRVPAQGKGPEPLAGDEET
ncbi:helix-turn-helix domain-containing protein [Streptomyces sp. F-1]|uniref:helix-turn-helix domain-containing protein n=1 Tax=Streptomyces sp. F-1 TaxID=463642 RepID=UPI00086D61A4|nr:helix-turn-helix domain-containing protein [Streptomyces sp. F-1]SFY51988.1 hypothetical protein STEPF1_05257 [Streptomyces sp. F-1]